MFIFLSLFLQVSDIPEQVDLSNLSLLLAFSKLCFTLFTGDFPWSWLRLASFSCWLLSQTKDSSPNFSNGKNGILALRVYGPIIWLFPSPTIPSSQDTRMTWIPFFVQQTAGHRVWGSDFYSYIILTVSLSAHWFKHRRVGELTPLPSLYSIPCHKPKLKVVKNIVIGYFQYNVFFYLYIYSKSKYLLSHVYHYLNY